MPTACAGHGIGDGPAYNIDPSPPIPIAQRGYLDLQRYSGETTTQAVYTLWQNRRWFGGSRTAR